MEYTYRFNARDESTSVLLDEGGITLEKGNQRELIAYSEIVSILISRSVRVYNAFLYPKNHRPVAISSQSYAADGTPIDQSSAYSLFIRVLHHHLKDKSRAEFKFGSKTGSVLKRSALAALLSFVVSLSVSYLGIMLVNPLVQSFAIAFAVFISIFLWYSSNMPKTYKPTEIPLRYLP